MTTKHLEYVLDRLLTRQTAVPGPRGADPAFRFNDRQSNLGNVFIAGRWFLDDVDLYLFHKDADDVALPVAGSLTLDDTSMVHIVATGYDLVTTLLVYAIGLNPLGQGLPTTRSLELAVAPAIPSGNFTIALPTGEEPPTITGTKKVWCTRRDFTGRDQLNIGDGSFFTLEDTRVIVRNDGSWSTMDTFTLEGETYTVRGVAQVGGRGRFLELVVRS